MTSRRAASPMMPLVQALAALVITAAIAPSVAAQKAPVPATAAPSPALCKALAVHRVNARIQTLAGAEKSAAFAASLAAASGKPAASRTDATAKPRAELATAMQLLMALGAQEGVMDSDLTPDIIRSGAFNACVDAHAARGRGIEEPRGWVVLTQLASETQVAFGASSIVRSGNRASYVSATRVKTAQPTSQGPSRFLIGATLVECGAAPTERPMSVVYLKPGSATPWRAIDVSVGRREFTAIMKGSAAERMAQLACGIRAFNAETEREPSLGRLIEGWNK